MTYLVGDLVWSPHPINGYSISKIKSTDNKDVVVEIINNNNNNNSSSTKTTTTTTPLEEIKISKQLLHSYNSSDDRDFDDMVEIEDLTSRSFHSMQSEKKNQSIIISGESGSGKTEASKSILQFLVHMSGGLGQGVEKDILDSNPLLEAFGNSRTTRNHNSSRFGKFLKIEFRSTDYRIVGASIETYLLEKSRISHRPDHLNLNYHIFYYLVWGASTQEKTKWGLESNPSRYRYLDASPDVLEGYKRSSMNPSQLDENYSTVKKSMQSMGLNRDEIDHVFQILSVILHLGNIEFIKDKVSNFASLSDNPQVSSSINIVSQLLGFPSPGLFRQSLLNRNLKASGRGSVYSRPMEVDQSEQARDALAKSLYLKLFHFIGIPWSTQNFQDNKDCIDLVEKKSYGILSLLDDECVMPKGSETLLIEKYNSRYHNTNQFYQRTLAKGTFGIKHFAGDVQYQTDGWLEKNRDILLSDLEDLLLSISVCGQFLEQLGKLVNTINSTSVHYIRCVKPNNTLDSNNFNSIQVLGQLRSVGILNTVQIRKMGHLKRKEFNVLLIQDQKRKELERKKQEEEERQRELERQKKEEEERQKELEKKRKEEERLKKEEEKRLKEEKKRLEEEEKLKRKEEERLKKEEEKRLKKDLELDQSQPQQQQQQQQQLQQQILETQLKEKKNIFSYFTSTISSTFGTTSINNILNSNSNNLLPNNSNSTIHPSSSNSIVISSENFNDNEIGSTSTSTSTTTTTSTTTKSKPIPIQQNNSPTGKWNNTNSPSNSAILFREKSRARIGRMTIRSPNTSSSPDLLYMMAAASSTSNSSPTPQSPQSPQIPPQLSSPSLSSPSLSSLSSSTSSSSSSSTTPTTTTPIIDENDLISKNKRLRAEVIREILITERDYVRDLLIVQEIFLTPIREKSILNQKEINILFSNIEILLSINKTVLEELEKEETGPNPNNDYENTKVGQAFLKMSHYLKMYNAYCANQQMALKFLEEEKLKNEEFRNFLQVCMADGRCRGLPLLSFIIKPVQRICKYPLLIKETLRFTPEDHPERGPLEEADKKISDIVVSINEGKRMVEMFQKIFDLQSSIEGVADDLMEPGRHLLLEGSASSLKELVLSNSNSNNNDGHQRTLFLFNDLILICASIKMITTAINSFKSKKYVYRLKGRIPITDARIMFVSDTDTVKYAIELWNTKEETNYILCFPNEQQRTQWFKQIKQLIQDYKISLNNTSKSMIGLSRKPVLQQQSSQQQLPTSPSSPIISSTSIRKSLTLLP
eukprot:gene6752-8373_t